MRHSRTAVRHLGQRVSIHAPGRGATKYLGREVVANCGFNSRTREGCDIFSFSAWETSDVSIHAPGRGATIYYDFYRRQDYVSIHAPGRGATMCALLSLLSLWFQFTHPGGVRLGRGSRRTRLRSVSIHAPGRGATCASCRLSQDTSFQFTHPGGVRQFEHVYSPSLSKFQFTHPGGVRLDRYLEVLVLLVVSIHAPGRGATHQPRARHLSHSRFNSRTREGCDLPVVTQSRFRSGFQFTHPGGVRLIYHLI